MLSQSNARDMGLMEFLQGHMEMVKNENENIKSTITPWRSMGYPGALVPFFLPYFMSFSGCLSLLNPTKPPLNKCQSQTRC